MRRKIAAFLLATSIFTIGLTFRGQPENIEAKPAVTMEVADSEVKEEVFNGWTKTSVNVRKGPNTDADILDTYSFNTEVKYTEYDENWIQIKYDNGVAYMNKNYISDIPCSYEEFNLPQSSGFKSFMSYENITSVTSMQYKLQREKAYTGNYGIRQIDGRYCVAIGSHFKTEIGTKFDLVLENGTIIPCIMADQKADQHTCEQNIITRHNGCVSEFIIDTQNLISNVKRSGDISDCKEEWNSPVSKIKVYH